MSLLKKIQLEDIANGATLLASGGGGSVETARKAITELLKITDSVELKKAGETGEDEWGAMAACIGSPTAGEGAGIHGASFRAFEFLEQITGKNFSYVFSVETGMNIFIAMLTAVKKNIPVIDGDGAGRSVPTLEMLTYSKAVSDSVFTIASQTSEDIKAALCAAHIKDIEDMARPFIGLREFSESAGIAGWAMDGKTIQNAVVPGTITLSENIGRTLREACEAGEEPVKALEKFFGDRFFLLFHGELAEKSDTTAGGFDTGIMTFRNSETELNMVYQNENMIAWDAKKDHPVAMAPDLICYLRSDGNSLSNADLKEGERIFIIGLKADERLRQSPMLETFLKGLKNVGYYGEYVPIEKLQAE